MTLLRATASEVAAMAAERSVEAGRSSLLEAMAAKRLVTYGYAVSSSEERSWQNSLPVLAADLAAAGLGDVEMLLEYALPLTSLRADAVLAGVHPDTGEPSYVVVELKQWSAAHRFESDDNLVEVPGMPGDPKGHPVAQVRNYCHYLTDFLATLEDQPDAVAGWPTCTTPPSPEPWPICSTTRWTSAGGCSPAPTDRPSERGSRAGSPAVPTARRPPTSCWAAR